MNFLPAPTWGWAAFLGAVALAILAYALHVTGAPL